MQTPPRRTLRRLASGFTRYEDTSTGAAWLFDGTTFWTYDDPPIMRAKAEYARERVYALDFDPRSIKIAKALNLIAGDGRTNMVCQ